MPRISSFYGITIAMFYGDHNPPHFHAYYADSSARFALERSHLEAFAGSEIAVVDEVIERFRGLSAEEISELSHAEPAWEQLEIGESIPYDTAYLAQPILTPGIREHALGLLERIRT